MPHTELINIYFSFDKNKSSRVLIYRNQYIIYVLYIYIIYVYICQSYIYYYYLIDRIDITCFYYNKNTEEE